MKRSLSYASLSLILTMRKMLTLLMMMMFIFPPSLFFRQKPKHNSGLHEEYDSRFPRLASSHYNLLLLPSLVVAAPLFISFRLNHLTCIRGMRKLRQHNNNTQSKLSWTHCIEVDSYWALYYVVLSPNYCYYLKAFDIAPMPFFSSLTKWRSGSVPRVPGSPFCGWFLVNSVTLRNSAATVVSPETLSGHIALSSDDWSLVIRHNHPWQWQ